MPAVQDEQRSTLPPGGGVAQDPILWVVPALSALSSRPAPNDAAIRKARAHSSDDVSLLTQLLNAAGFSAVPRALSDAEIAQQARPLVALLRNDGNSDSHAAVEAGLVLAANDSHVLLAERHHPPRQVPLDSFVARFTGQALVVADSAPTVADPDAISATARDQEFGFRWFVSELLKHKPISREVLIASLVIQLLALALPLFTQAIIDKVVVHRTQSTLITLAVAMGVFLMFTAALTWVRLYLVLVNGKRPETNASRLSAAPTATTQPMQLK